MKVAVVGEQRRVFANMYGKPKVNDEGRDSGLACNMSTRP